MALNVKGLVQINGLGDDDCVPIMLPMFQLMADVLRNVSGLLIDIYWLHHALM